MELNNSKSLIESNLAVWRDKIDKDYKGGRILPGDLCDLFQQQELKTAFYKIIDHDSNGAISLQEWTGCFFKLSGDSDPSLIKWFVDNFEKYCSRNGKIKVSEQDFSFFLTKEFGMRLFELISPKSISMNTEQFITALEKIASFNTQAKLHSWLKFKFATAVKAKHCDSAQNSQKSWFQRNKETLMNNRDLLIFWLIYALIHMAVTIFAFNNYREMSGWIICARIFGNGLNFNCMLLLILVIKKHFTWVRAKDAGTILPIDDYKILSTISKKVGIIILFETLIHTIAHLINLYDVCKATGFNYWTVLFTNKITMGFPTGVLGFILLVLILIFILMMFRKREYFKFYYLVCILSIVWLLIMFFHGKDFWKWLLAPVVYYAIENLQRHREIFSRKLGDEATTEEV